MKVDEKNLLEVLQQVKLHGYTVNPLVVNESLMKRVEKVRSFVYQMDNETNSYWVDDIEDNCVIYSKSGRDVETKLYKQGYAITADEKVTFVGDPVEVIRKVEYETVITNNTVTKRTRKINNFKKEDDMSTEKCTPCVLKKVNALIANATTQFAETDRVWLETLEEDQLDRMEPTAVTTNEKIPTITPEMAVNALKDALKGQDDFINLMPANMQEQTRSALKLHQDHKAGLVDKIINNTEEGTWTKEELAVYEVEKLEKIAKTAGVKQGAQTANYVGMGAGTSMNNNSASNDVEPMPLAGMTFTK